jgi:hypothetical protein
VLTLVLANSVFAIFVFVPVLPQQSNITTCRIPPATYRCLNVDGVPAFISYFRCQFKASHSVVLIHYWFRTNNLIWFIFSAWTSSLLPRIVIPSWTALAISKTYILFKIAFPQVYITFLKIVAFYNMWHCSCCKIFNFRNRSMRG